MSNPIDEYFKKNLADVEVAPRKDLFAEKIAPRIEQRKAGYFFSPWLRVAAAVVVLFGAWQIMQMVNTPQPGTIMVLPEEKPIAVQPPSVTSVPKNDVVVNAEQIKKAEPIRQATKNNKGLVSTTPAGKAPENLPETQVTQSESADSAVALAETKPSYKVKLRIDPAKYATQTQEEAVETASVDETPSLTEYAATQFDNIKDGEKLEAPPKQWFELPKLAVRLEGNPLKKVLNGNE